jgi:hypothetical protein
MKSPHQAIAFLSGAGFLLAGLLLLLRVRAR